MGRPMPDHRRDDPLERLMHLRAERLDQETLNELLHELRVHHEELSAQNTQLVETQRALEETRDRYVDLYDFAPIGYMTTNENGTIREINLTGAVLLRRERNNIIGLPFHAFVVSADKTKYADHLRQFRQLQLSSSTVELELNGNRSEEHTSELQS